MLLTKSDKNTVNYLCLSGQYQDIKMALGSDSGEVAEGVFYKDADERNSPSKFGNRYDSIEDEYRALNYLKTAHDRFMPGVYVQPLGMVVDDEGNVDGYLMENVEDAVEVDELMNSPERYDVDTGRVVDQLYHLKQLKDFLPADGDLYPRNLLVEKDTSKLRVIDPLGLDEEEAMREERQESDKKQLDDMIDSLSDSPSQGVRASLEQGKRPALG